MHATASKIRAQGGGPQSDLSWFFYFLRCVHSTRTFFHDRCPSMCYACHLPAAHVM